MSPFEIIMLVCFGAAWPVSILKSFKTGENGGKSVVFLFIILVGYSAGITHKALFSNDAVIVLYILNAVMVSIDILLYFRNAARERKIFGSWTGQVGRGATGRKSEKKDG